MLSRFINFPAENIINRKLKAAKKRDSELETRIRSQREYIASLNRKIEGKKMTRKAAKRAGSRKIIRKIITPKKINTKTETPKKIVEIIRTKKPFI